MESMTNKCIFLLDKFYKGEKLEIPIEFVMVLCNHHLHLYSRLIDANYVNRPLDPLVSFDSIH